MKKQGKKKNVKLVLGMYMWDNGLIRNKDLLRSIARMYSC